jgi:predicted AAA+ superfamily ATPase
MYYRKITPQLHDALADSPVVLLGGARQTGKTTLARQFVPSLARPLPGLDENSLALPDATPARTYLTLDDSTVLAAAKSDPAGFIAGLRGPVVIDEVQHAPDLFPAIKASVDRDRQPGRFLLTGSANVLLLPRLSESLAGRMEILTLRPLAQAEIEGTTGSVTDLLFSGDLPTMALPAVVREDLIRRLLYGGYPEPLTRTSETRRRAWFTSYLTTILQRDVRDISNIADLSNLPRLLALLASRTASLLNLSDVSTSVKIPYSTLQRYMKDASWSQTQPSLFHFRTHARQEVDVVMESPSGQIVGVEVKAAGSVKASDFAGMRLLAETASTRFTRGVVLYTGEQVVPFGPNLYGVPVSLLWSQPPQG